MSSNPSGSPRAVDPISRSPSPNDSDSEGPGSDATVRSRDPRAATVVSLEEGEIPETASSGDYANDLLRGELARLRAEHAQSAAALRAKEQDTLAQAESIAQLTLQLAKTGKARELLESAPIHAERRVSELEPKPFPSNPSPGIPGIEWGPKGSPIPIQDLSEQQIAALQQENLRLKRMVAAQTTISVSDGSRPTAPIGAVRVKSVSVKPAWGAVDANSSELLSDAEGLSDPEYEDKASGESEVEVVAVKAKPPPSRQTLSRRSKDRTKAWMSKEISSDEEDYSGRDPRFTWTPTFNGRPGTIDFEDWIETLRNQMAAQPRIYTNDDARIRFCLSYLKDDAHKWALAMQRMVPMDEMFYNFRNFVKGLSDTYGCKDRKGEASIAIEGLRHTKGSRVGDYLAQLETYARIIGLNDAGLYMYAKKQLTTELLDDMSKYSVKQDTWSRFKKAALHCDQRIHQRVAERKLQEPRTAPVVATPPVTAPNGANPKQGNLRQVVSSPNSIPLGPKRPSGSTPSPSYNSPTPSSDGTPFKIPPAGGKLPLDEKARRIQHGLCLYCGAKDHAAESCKLLADAERKKVLPFAGKASAGQQ